MVMKQKYINTIVYQVQVAIDLLSCVFDDNAELTIEKDLLVERHIEALMSDVGKLLEEEECSH